MLKRGVIVAILVLICMLSGCATVPMASIEQDMALKAFPKPSQDKAALYVYRNSLLGAALKKDVYLDGLFLGESAHKVYFYKEIQPGQHELSTESEFSNNSISFTAVAGKNYFAEQYMKPGVFVGGANLQMVSEEEGMKNVAECNLAITPSAAN